MQEQNQGVLYITLGWVFFAISLLFIPILFGAGTFIMGFLTYRTYSQIHGMILMVFSVVGIVLGMLIGIIASIA